MSWRVIVRTKAHEDVSQAAIWYERQQSGLGSLFLEKLDDLLTRISCNPWQFPVIETNVRRGLMERFPYGVYFIADTSHIDIISVLHLHKKPGTWKHRT